MSLQTKLWYQKNKEAKKKYQRKYYLDNKEKNKETSKKFQRKWREENKEKIKLYAKKWREKNKEAIKQYQKKWREENEETKKEYQRKYYLENRETIDKRKKKYNEKNKEKIKLYAKKYREKNKKYFRNWEKEKKKNDVNFKLASNVRIRVLKALKGNKKTQKTIKLLDCNINQLWNYLESKFESGMTKENHGLYGWHLDHKIPCSAFDLRCPIQQITCFHYSNLQPLWAKDNLKKGRKND